MCRPSSSSQNISPSSSSQTKRWNLLPPNFWFNFLLFLKFLFHTYYLSVFNPCCWSFCVASPFIVWDEKIWNIDFGLPSRNIIILPFDLVKCFPIVWFFVQDSWKNIYMRGILQYSWANPQQRRCCLALIPSWETFLGYFADCSNLPGFPYWSDLVLEQGICDHDGTNRISLPVLDALYNLDTRTE